MRRWAAGSRWTLGATITSIGGLIVVSYWVYTLEESKPFWSVPTFVGILICVVGFGFIIVGGAGEEGADPRPPVQHQIGGPGSMNLQSGRDINVKHAPEGDDG